MIFIAGGILGFIFWKLFAGNHEGENLERSFRFLIRGHYLHIHH
jgi:hypothetical protein